MAKFNSTTFGTISGRHGSAVASTTKDGQSILKVYKAPSNPNTVAQVNQRSKFGFVNSELSQLRDIFKVTYRSGKGMNLAVSYALKNAVSGSADNLVMDYTKICFAWGSIQLPEKIDMKALPGANLQFDWDTTLRIEDQYPDELNIILMNVSSKFTILRESIALRPAGNTVLNVPEIWAGNEVHCWLYFSSPESTLTSVSKYLGTIEIKA